MVKFEIATVKNGAHRGLNSQPQRIRDAMVHVDALDLEPADGDHITGAYFLEVSADIVFVELDLQ